MAQKCDRESQVIISGICLGLAQHFANSFYTFDIAPGILDKLIPVQVSKAVIKQTQIALINCLNIMAL